MDTTPLLESVATEKPRKKPKKKYKTMKNIKAKLVFATIYITVLAIMVFYDKGNMKTANCPPNYCGEHSEACWEIMEPYNLEIRYKCFCNKGYTGYQCKQENECFKINCKYDCYINVNNLPQCTVSSRWMHFNSLQIKHLKVGELILPGASHAFFNFAHPRLSDFSRLPEMFDNRGLFDVHLKKMPKKQYQKLARNIRDPLAFAEKFGRLSSTTQNFTASQLFRKGVRYFHADIENNKEAGIVVTNSLIGDKLDTLVKDLTKELYRNPGEFLLLHIGKALCHPGDCLHMDNLVAKMFEKDKLYHDDLVSLKDTRVNDILVSEGRFIVVYPRVSRNFYLGIDSFDMEIYNSVGWSQMNRTLLAQPDLFDNWRSGNMLSVINSALISNLTELVFVLLNEDDMFREFAQSVYAEYMNPGSRAYSVVRAVRRYASTYDGKYEVPCNVVAYNYVTDFTARTIIDINVGDFKIITNATKIPED